MSPFVAQGFRLSPQQRRLWNLQQEETGFPYRVQGALRITGPLDLAALQGALRSVAARHEILRTTFSVLPDLEGPAQVVGEPSDLTLSPLGSGGEGLFHLERDPPFEASLTALAPDDHLLLLSAHALIADAASLGVIARDLRDGYAGIAGDEPPQYADLAEALNELLESEAGRAFWRERAPQRLLDEQPVLPFEQRAAESRGFSPAWVEEPLEPEGVRRARALAGERGASLSTVFLAAWQALLLRLSGTLGALVTGVELSGRAEGLADAVGPLARHVPVRVAGGTGDRFCDFVDRLRQDLDLATDRQESFEWKGPGAFAACFGYGSMPRLDAGGGASFSLQEVHAVTDRFALRLACRDDGESVVVSLQYDATRFDEGAARRLLSGFHALLAAALCDPGSRVSDLDLVGAAERREIDAWNDTGAVYEGSERLLHELIGTQCRRTPDAVAVSAGEESLTYGELSARAEELARRLRRLGVGPEVMVGVCAERSVEMTVGLLGVLESGGAYLPLDPSYPRERLAWMVEDARLPVLLAQERLLDRLPPHAARVVLLDRPGGGEDSAAIPPIPPIPDVGPGSLAYALFTSGSTGRPKGAMNSHRAVVNRLLWMQEAYGLTPADHVLQKTPVSFDVSVWELFWPLLAGARLVMAAPDGHRNPIYLVRAIEEEGITTLHFVPSMLRIFLEEPDVERCASLRRVIASGEALPADLTARFFARLDARLHNLYGPTEAAVDVTAWECEPGSDQPPPIGRPVANTRIEIVDETLRRRLPGLPGELCIGGVQVGRGYLARPDLTAERFVPDPFAGRPGARLYRTGDLARHRPDGALEYLGRIDHQVKVRGVRIELGEIEAALMDHPGVRQAVVVAREEQPGDVRLVAYVVPGGEQDGSDPAALRWFLAERLPEAFVPSVFVSLPALPLTPSGKVDRKALPSPEAGAYGRGRAGGAPRTEVERAIAAVWREMLGAGEIGREDSFFEVGGHSLLGTRLIYRLREALGVEIELRDLFEAPVLAGLAARVEAALGRPRALPLVPLVPLQPVPRDGGLPLSFAQQRLWFLDRLAPGNPVYNMYMVHRFAGDLDEPALAAAFGELTRVHESLRTVFPEVEGRPVQAILPPAAPHLPVADLGTLPPERRLPEAERLARAELRRPFDLARGPLLRLLLLRLEKGKRVLVVTLHHIVSDAWSMAVLRRDLIAAYQAFAERRPPALPELPVQYADFAVWQRRWLQGEVRERELEYWARRLAGLPVLELPTDRPRPARQSFRGASVDLRIGRPLTGALKELARDGGVTPFLLLLAAFEALLQRWTGQREIVLGIPVANRERAELEGLIGFFVNTLVLRADLGGEPSFRALTGRLQEVALGAFAHQSLPFESVVEALEPERDLSRQPLFQVMFQHLDVPLEQGDLPGLAAEPVEVDPGITQFDLVLDTIETPAGLTVSARYATDLFDGVTIQRLLGQFRRLLAGIAVAPETPVPSLPLLGEGERHQLLREWNDAAPSYPREAGLQELFETVAARVPDAVALSFGGLQVSYGELNRRANRLAHRLAELGVGPESPVGLLLGRSVPLLVATIAVLKAGGCYLPLDPEHPAERLAYMLADSGASVLVTAQGRAEGLRVPGIRTLLLDEEEPALAAMPDGNPACKTSGGHLAYVMYTSGSTGRPKGVAIPQRGVARLVLGVDYVHLGPDDHISQSSNASFDVVTFEIWGALLHGARMVGFTRDEVLSAATLATRLAEREITILFVTTALFLQLAREDPSLFRGMREVLFGGEAVDPGPVRDVLAAGGPRRLLNLYGPTESTTFATWHRVEQVPAGAMVPIGRPVDNTHVHILDPWGGLALLGAPGELAVGGDGLARGYLGRPDLTAERFVPDPFPDEPGGRLYRTGDLVRRLPAGDIVFLGRIDQQVKIRGFRVEPGEVAALLAEHPAVRESAVVVRQDGAGESRLVAYVVPEPRFFAAAGATAWSGEQVAGWEEVFDQVYRREEELDPAFDIVGWDSTYTGEPLPQDEMREWLGDTVDRILSLAPRRPRRMMEIGCGTGMLLLRLAPGCEDYLGTDVSAEGLRRLRHHLERIGDPPQVRLEQRPAHRFDGLAPGSFDTVILNSVVQYFPGIDHLAAVLAGAVEAVRPGGAVFVGDVRSLPLLGAFHLDLELAGAPADLSLAALRRQARARALEENELAVDPAFFLSLGRQLPRVARVEIHPKRGRAHNELTAFRYQVVLRVGTAPAAEPIAAPITWRDWRGESLDLMAIRELLEQERPEVLALRNIPNTRTARAAAAVRLVSDLTDGADITVGDLRQSLAGMTLPGVEPQDLLDLATELGYGAELGWSNPGPEGDFEAVLHRGAAPAVMPSSGEPLPAGPWSRFANDPLQGKFARQVVPELRRFLGERLLEPMVPSAFVVLGALPLSPNGKVDRGALPEPDFGYRETAEVERVLPRDPEEEILARIWADILGLDAVSVRSSFFDLGGHSLLAAQVVARIRRDFAVEVGLSALFEAPTIEALARHVRSALRGGRGAELPPVVPLPRPHEGRPLVPSFGQQRLWFLDRLEPGGNAYNMPLAFRLDGDLSQAALEHALAEVVRRHEVLRTVYRLVDGQPAQVVEPFRPLPLPRIDLAGLPAGARDAEARRLGGREIARPFDLTGGPVLRALLLRLGAREHLGVLTLHHIAGDGWSLGVMLREIATLYEAFAAGRAPSLPEPVIQYADFAAWQRGWLRGPVLEAQLAWWRRHLAGAPPVLDLPTDRPRTTARNAGGRRGGRRPLSLPAGLWLRLRRLAADERTTPFVLLVSAFQALLARLTGQRDLTTGMPIAGRRHVETEGLVGFFVNTLVLRADLAGDPSFREAVHRMHGVTLGAFSHQDLPFERLVEELQPERSLSHTPLFQAMFALQNLPEREMRLPGLTLAPAEVDEPAVRFDLELQTVEEGGTLVGLLQYAADLFDAPTAERFVGHLSTLLSSLADHPGRRLSELDLLRPDERQQLLEWGSGAVLPAPDAVTVLDLFAARVAASPDAPALVWGGSALTYRDLDVRSGAVAAALAARGVRPGDVVGLRSERSPGLVTGLLGIWKAGAVFLPLDPAYPEERLDFMIRDAGAVMVVAGELEGEDEGRGALHPVTAAYLIYTSGTTGTPKAVLVEHGSLLHTLRAVLGTFPFAPGERMPCIAPFSFDIFLFELLVPLLSGGTSVLLPLQPTLDLDQLLAELRLSTHFHAVPAVLRQVVDEVLADGDPSRYAGLREIFVGGEAVPADLLAAARAAFPAACLRVLYGPTEATILATAHRAALPEAEPRSLLGRPLPGVLVQLTDLDGNPVPAGVAGEILLAGPGVTRGYLNRPELTAERYVPGAVGSSGGSRLYRTGDLARWLPGGTLEFLGRTDEQVKVRGFRIEPGEIEARLAAHPAVRQAVVVVQGQAGGTHLAAFFVAQDGTVSASAAELRSHLGSLPDYMVPSTFTPLESLPLTRHGKVDRQALARLTRAARPVPAHAVGPGTPEAEILAGIWAEVLGRDRVGIRDDFFELGGHSLLAARVVSRVRQVLGVEIELRSLFEAPTVEGMAARVRKALAWGEGLVALPPIRPVPREGSGVDRPLSFGQERLWFLDRLEPGSPAYNMPLVLRLTGDLDAPALERAVAETVRRHEILRTVYPEIEGAPVQRVLPPRPFPLPVVDLSRLPAELREAEAGELAAAEASRPFDLNRGPVLRGTLLRLDPREHLALLVLHHIAGDGWSMGVLTREISAHYRGAANRLTGLTLPELPLQYGDFAAWQRRWLAGEVLDAQLAWWRERLAGAPPVLEIPTGRPRPATRSPRAGLVAVDLPEELCGRLRELAAREGVTLFALLLASFQALLARASGQTDASVGTPVAGRRQVETEGLIGFFVNTLVLRTDLSGDPPFRELLGRVWNGVLGAFSHQDLPFELLVKELQPSRDLSHTPLFQVLFALQNLPVEAADLPALTLSPVPLDQHQAVQGVRFDLELNLAESEGRIGGGLHYAADLFTAAEATRLVADLTALLGAVAADPGVRLSALGVPANERVASIAPLIAPPGVAAAPPVPLRTPVEELVAAIWADVLGREASAAIGGMDDFFELGGHSLLATRVVSRLRQAFRLDLPVRALFEASTVTALARRIEEQLRAGERSVLPPLHAAARDREIPLSFAQQRLWFLDRLSPGVSAYNLFSTVRLTGPLDLPALAAALSEIVRRHESLRTSFPLVDGRPIQSIAPPSPVSLPVLDLAGLSDPRAEARRLALAEERHPFDLARGPLLRCHLLRLREPDEHLLLAGVHHAVCDGWALGLLMEETAALYHAFSAGEPSPLPDLPVQYADFAVWQRQWLRGELLERETAWWRRHLEGAPAVLGLPLDRPRPPVQSFRGGFLPLVLPAAEAAAVSALGRREGATLFMVLLAGLDALLHRLTGEDRIPVGTPIANRGTVELERLIGNFANTLVLCTPVDGAPSFSGLLGRARETALGAYAHQDLPFEILVEALAPRRDLSYNPLFQVLLGLHNLPAAPPRPAGALSFQALPAEGAAARFDLALDLAEVPDGLAGSLEYAADLFDAATAVRLGRGFRILLQSATATPERKVSELPLLDPAERQQLLVEWNDSAAEPPAGGTLHGLVAAWAERTPDSVAAVCGEARLTYGELCRRAGRLARRLRQMGVGPEGTVGVLTDRSLEMLVALLGVLQAGGAYLPLDPAHPEERRARLLADAGARWVVGRDATGLDTGPDGPPALPENLAYVIYTSGSTGQPKGVQVPHAGAAHLVETARRRFGFAPADVWTAVHSYAFDFSVWEIWCALASGGRLVVVPAEVTRDPAALRHLLDREQVTILSQTPSALRQLVAAAEPAHSLRWIVCGGEAFPADLVPELAAWQERAPVWSFYGPTESTVWAAAGPVAAGADADDDSEGVISLGEPLPNHRLYVLSSPGGGLEPLPASVPGELHISGPGLSRGYLGRPDLTAERFVPDPFAGVPGSRLYRTGDLARRLPGGALAFLCRMDRQLKVRGFRIEPAEIEAALTEHPGVRQAAVVPLGEGDERTLAAWVVPAGEAPPAAGLRRFLEERLPAYMVPSRLTFLEALPLTANGKLDRRALEQSAARAVPAAVGVAPRGATELELARIWEELLAGPVHVHDDFFGRGGHSLLAVRLMARVRDRFGLDLPVSLLFQRPTLEALAAAIAAIAAIRDRSEPAPDPLLVPLQPGLADAAQGAPLFLVHPVGGEVLCYADLARELMADRPLYGLRSPDAAGEPPSIERLASLYLQAIREVQPTGPYLLGGWSMGAVVAWEMTHQLRATGDDVDLLLLLDPPLPGDGPAEEPGGAHPKEPSTSPRPHQPHPPRQPMEAAPLDTVFDSLLRHDRIYRRNAAALDAYRPRPLPTLPTRVALFMAETPEAGAAAPAWAALTGGGAETRSFAADHFALLRQPAVEPLAAALRQLLAADCSVPGLRRHSIY